jgi:hypothetical protein
MALLNCREQNEKRILHHVLDVTKGRTVGPTGVMGKKEEFDDTVNSIHDSVTSYVIFQYCFLTNRSEKKNEKVIIVKKIDIQFSCDKARNIKVPIFFIRFKT